MKKTTSIRLFLVLATLVCCGAYGGGYYFSMQQSQKPAELETARKDAALAEDSQKYAESTESAAVVAPYEYILCEEDGYIIVFYADRETVYANTDIPLNSLSSQMQKEILEGKFIYSETELYNFLESYSS